MGYIEHIKPDVCILKKPKRIKRIILVNHFDDIKLRIWIDMSNEIKVEISPMPKDELEQVKIKEEEHNDDDKN